MTRKTLKDRKKIRNKRLDKTEIRTPPDRTKGRHYKKGRQASDILQDLTRKADILTVKMPKKGFFFGLE